MKKVMKTVNNFMTKYCIVFLRIALGIAFLSAVADRFGYWGQPGEASVAWGNFDNFLDYVAVLNPYLPDSLIPAVGWGATIAEIALGAALILGYRLRPAALMSGILLLIFAVSMVINTGLKSPLDYSVFTASAAAFFLYVHAKDSFSLDSLRSGSGKVSTTPAESR